LQQVNTNKDYAVTVLHTSQTITGHTGSSQSVTILTSRCSVATSNGGCSPPSGFQSCPRPQLPASHSNSSHKLNPSGYLTNRNLKLCYDRRSIGQSVLMSSTHLGPKNRILLLSDSFGFVLMWGALSDERTGVSFQLLLALASAVILGSKSRGPMSIFYCLRFETRPIWRARSPHLYPPGSGWPSYTPRHWVPFLLPIILRTTVEILEPASTRESPSYPQLLICPAYNILTRTPQTTLFLCCCLRAVAQ
jgi:hypothetical protein